MKNLNVSEMFVLSRMSNELLKISLKKVYKGLTDHQIDEIILGFKQGKDVRDSFLEKSDI